MGEFSARGEERDGFAFGFHPYVPLVHGLVIQPTHCLGRKRWREYTASDCDAPIPHCAAGSEERREQPIQSVETN